jgi:hypothetical protein
LEIGTSQEGLRSRVEAGKLPCDVGSLAFRFTGADVDSDAARRAPFPNPGADGVRDLSFHFTARLPGKLDIYGVHVIHGQGGQWFSSIEPDKHPAMASLWGGILAGPGLIRNGTALYRFQGGCKAESMTLSVPLAGNETTDSFDIELDTSRGIRRIPVTGVQGLLSKARYACPCDP